MDTLKKLKIFPDKWFKKLTEREIDQGRQQLKSYTTSTTLETSLKEQLITIEASLREQQDLYRELRQARRAGEPVPVETIQQWEDKMAVVDKVTRDRLFILTVAAEKGWSVASDLAAGMRGDNADKHLAKAVKKDDKKKAEARKEKVKDKPQRRGGYRGGFRPQPYPMYNPYGAMNAMNPYAPYQGQPHVPPAYGARPDPKSCSHCRQMGHYFRNCPYRPTPPAALGVAPK